MNRDFWLPSKPKSESTSLLTTQMRMLPILNLSNNLSTVDRCDAPTPRKDTPRSSVAIP